jgi:hypothetical protein
MAIACFRLFTRPPLPAVPERNVPCFFRRIALLTDFPAAFPYLGIVASLAEQTIAQQRYRDETAETMRYYLYVALEINVGAATKLNRTSTFAAAP